MIKKERLKRFLCFCMAVLLACGVPVSTASAKNGYYDGDFFETVMNHEGDSYKGLQGAQSWYQYTPPGEQAYGISHTFFNALLNEYIYDENSGRGTAYSFEGTTVRLDVAKIRSNIVNWAKIANDQEMTCSVQFMVEWKGQESVKFLVDEGSRTYPNGRSPYYAPATSGYGKKAIRAFWDCLMKELAKANRHIDNFILGNEVNMPHAYHYSGTSDPWEVTRKYASSFYDMYDVVRRYSDNARCSICIDHSWNQNDEGRGIAARDFLDKFDEQMKRYGSNIDWCVSTHLYPAVLWDARIWEEPHADAVGEELTTDRVDSLFVDGSNLHVMTDYIREHFGEEHRVMLTEQGFTKQNGDQAQAAALAYSYYAAKYDPMVDCFIMNLENAGTTQDFYGNTVSMDFRFSSLATEVFKLIGRDNAADQKRIAEICLPVIGVNSWKEIVPHYGEVPEKNEPYYGNINSELMSFDLKQNAGGASYLTGEIVVVEWVNNLSTVPKATPVMTFETTDGTEKIDVFVTPTGTNTYYFDRFIEGLSPDKEYVFKIASGSELNISPNRSMNVYLSTSPKVESKKDMGKIGTQTISYHQADNGELRLYRKREQYVGNINSELKKTQLVTGPNGNYVSGEIVVVEWVNGLSTVPSKKPVMYFESTDKTEKLEAWVTATGTNTYYFDRSLGDLDVSKEYVFSLESGDSLNISPYRSMIVTTAVMNQKEGLLWESAKQFVRYKTDPNTGELRIFGVNK